MFLGQKPEWQIPYRHFCPATPSSGCRILHLYYSLLSLQQEIEKRTFYLGKYRTDENGNKPHLLDLIGMSRDEADILYPFAKSAMADVFDALHSSTIGIPKQYKWEDKPNVITIRRRPKVVMDGDVEYSNFVAAAQTDKIKITGTIIYQLGSGAEITNDDLDKDLCRPNVSIIVSYKTKRYSVATSEEVITPHSEIVTLDRHCISRAERGATRAVEVYMHHDVSCYIPFYLEQQNGILTEERLEGDVEISTYQMNEYWEYTNPVKVVSGTRFTISNNNQAPAATMYDALTEFDENDLPDKLGSVADIVEQGEIIDEGIHYYFEFPNYFNESLIEPLDNAILEALVNRVIWHWLILSYPAEAATYDSLYQSSIAALKTRSDVFQKHWATRTPRIL